MFRGMLYYVKQLLPGSGEAGVQSLGTMQPLQDEAEEEAAMAARGVGDVAPLTKLTATGMSPGALGMVQTGTLTTELFSMTSTMSTLTGAATKPPTTGGGAVGEGTARRTAVVVDETQVLIDVIRARRFRRLKSLRPPASRDPLSRFLLSTRVAPNEGVLGTNGTETVRLSRAASTSSCLTGHLPMRG